MEIKTEINGNEVRYVLKMNKEDHLRIMSSITYGISSLDLKEKQAEVMNELSCLLDLRNTQYDDNMVSIILQPSDIPDIIANLVILTACLSEETRMYKELFKDSLNGYKELAEKMLDSKKGE